VDNALCFLQRQRLTRRRGGDALFEKALVKTRIREFGKTPNARKENKGAPLPDDNADRGEPLLFSLPSALE